MKILNAAQIREADAFTILNEPIRSIELMEKASRACANWIKEKCSIENNFKIICGTGNNGGDGLAIARILAALNYTVEVFIINHSENRSTDFIVNLERIRSTQSCSLNECHSFEIFQTAFVYNNKTIIIDALFGSGLNKPVKGFAADVIKTLNESGCKIISIDLPSGLFCDQLNSENDTIIKADYTLTFQFPKRSFLFPETNKCVGEFSILDIGLSNTYIDNAKTSFYFTQKEDIVPQLRKRDSAAHKGKFGHSLIIAGSYGKMGAAVLAARACLRSGTGLLTVHVPKCGYEIIQSAVPEAMADTDKEENFISGNLALQHYNAIGVGPGIGKQEQTQTFLKLLIQNSAVPIVFDADAINILSENKTWLEFIPAKSIFTPHPKEFDRIAGTSANSEERLVKQIAFSKKNGAYVVLKGAHTAISCPDGSVFFNSTGNPGMAKGGSGDALTGIITGLFAQGYTSEQAAVIGVFIHGLAGDMAAKMKSKESMIPSDIIDSLGDVFNYLLPA